MDMGAAFGSPPTIVDIEVCIPWSAGDSHREAALEWVTQRWRELGHEPNLVSLPDWSQPRAVNEAARRSGAEVLVIADADTWCDGTEAAIKAACAGAAWAMPHRTMHRLSFSSTAQVLRGADLDVRLPLEEPSYADIKGAGCCAVQREVLLDCPWDERFVGWSKFARAWRAAMTTLHGDPWRGDGHRWHLWHPPQPRAGRVTALDSASEELAAAYERARGDVGAIRELLAGAR